jgi:hypothetical protein
MLIEDRYTAEVSIHKQDLESLEALLKNGWTSSKIFVVYEIIRSIVHQLKKP